MTPPAGFLRDLTAYDPSLRLRWGPLSRLWLIERKMPERHRQLLAERPNPWQSPKGLDLYAGWKEGYVHVLSVHPDCLDRRVFDVLADADAHRQGGMDAINRKLDELAAAEEAAADRTVDTFVEGAASEAYDRLAWLQGRRVRVPDQVTDDAGPA